MVETTVFKITSDVETTCHCGHEIHKGDVYFMLRTNVPKWISLCTGCVALIERPTEVCMKELSERFFGTHPSDGRAEERRERSERKSSVRKAREERVVEL